MSDTTSGERHLSDREQASLIGESWFTWDEICSLVEPVEPPSLRVVLSDLVPEGPWSSVPD